MSTRQNVNNRANSALARLVALAAFVMVFIGGASNAHAARAPAPMCTPDGQSMPAPLQRTALSEAEIRRDTCPGALGPSWDVLPDHPSLPINWTQFAGDPLWVGELSVRAPRAAIAEFVGYETPQVQQSGFASNIFRPPRGALGA